MSILDQATIADAEQSPSWPDVHAQEPRRLVRLADGTLGSVGGRMMAELVLVLYAPPKKDRMQVRRAWGGSAAGMAAELFAPPGSLLAHVTRSVGYSRLRVLPMLGMPGSGPGRGMGSTLAACDGVGGLLLVARLPRQPAFSAGDVGVLRGLLDAAASDDFAAAEPPEARSSRQQPAADDCAASDPWSRQLGHPHVGLGA